MTAETFTPSVDTTCLPKTSGLVFFERLRARADKGRVFGLAQGAAPLPAQVQIIDNPLPISLNAGQVGRLSVNAIGNYELSYQWQYNAGDGPFRNATKANIEQNFPGADYIFVQGDKTSTLRLLWLTGIAPTEFRCRVRDTDPNSVQSQAFTTTTDVTYIGPFS